MQLSSLEIRSEGREKLRNMNKNFNSPSVMTTSDDKRWRTVTAKNPVWETRWREKLFLVDGTLEKLFKLWSFSPENTSGSTSTQTLAFQHRILFQFHEHISFSLLWTFIICFLCLLLSRQLSRNYSFVIHGNRARRMTFAKFLRWSHSNSFGDVFLSTAQVFWEMWKYFFSLQ